MKKDIAVIRQSITKVVSLLTQRSITVTQRGSKAFVSYHKKTGAIIGVNLPFIPDDASDEFIAAIQGFLDHEVGHVLYTDPKVLAAASKGGKRLANIHNIIEDVYVERKIAEAFAGSGGNLNAVREFYLNRIAKPKIEEAIKRGDLADAVGYASVVQFRAWGGQTIAKDFLKDNPHIAALTKPMADKLGPELIERIAKLTSSKDALKLATACKEKLEEKPEPPEEEPGKDAPGGAPSGSGGADDAGEPGEGGEPPPEEGATDDASAPPDDEGTVSTEADDSGKEREDGPSKTEETTDAAGDAGGEGESADSAEPEGRDDPTVPDGTPDDTPADERSGPDADDSDDADAEDMGDMGGASSSTPDADGEDEAEAEDGTSSTPSEEGDVPSGTPKPSSSDKTEPETETEPEPEPDHGEAFDDERDFDDDMSKELSKVATSEMASADYKIFSNEWDVIEPGPLARSPGAADALVERTSRMISGIQKGLERAMAARARKTWNPGQRRGRISPGALFRTAVGDDRVFRTRFETQAKDTAVSLLVDCSGSMTWGDRIGTAGTAAYALASTLERLKIKNEVLGFTTLRGHSAMDRAIAAEGMGLRYSRLEPLYMPVFKNFNERLTTEATSRIAHLTERPGWLSENVDGECVRIAAHRLKTQRAERHVLIVLSDGAPACPGDYHALSQHLSSVVKELDEQGGVEVIGVGIQTRTVASYYKKHVILNDLEDLPTTVVSELARVLLAA